jgi:hypothetical protein
MNPRMRVEECSPVVEALHFKRWNLGYGQKRFQSLQSGRQTATMSLDCDVTSHIQRPSSPHPCPTTLDRWDLPHGNQRIISSLPSEEDFT